MGKLHKIVSGVVFMAFLWMKAVSANAATEHIAMLMLDAFRRDYLSMYNLPNIHRLVDTGVWVAESNGVFPACTTPNQASFVTGAYPSVTLVPNNRYYDRTTDTIISSPRIKGATTIVEAFKAAGKSTAVVNHFHVLGQADTNVGPNASAEDAVKVVKTKKPSLMVYYYPNTDSVGHKYGPYSPQMRAEAIKADNAVGQIVQAYKDAGIYDKTLFVVASDHSMSSNNAPAIPIRVNDALRQAGFTVYDDQANSAKIPDDVDVVSLQVGSTFLYLRQPTTTGNGESDLPIEEKYFKLIEVLRTLPDVNVFDKSALRDMNTNPYQLGDAVVSPYPGMLMLPSSGTGGIHGRPQEEPTLMIFSGAGVKKQTIVQSANIVDIVPTLMAISGIPISQTVGGKVLSSVIQ